MMRRSVFLTNSCVRDDLDPGYLSSPEVMIHKKDFLIHIKKISSRSQSSDCTAEQKTAEYDEHQRRSSSTSARRLLHTGSKTQGRKKQEILRSAASESNVSYAKGVTHNGAKLYKSNEMKKTSSQEGRQSLSDLSKNKGFKGSSNNMLDRGPARRAQFSVLNLVGPVPSDNMRKSLIHGVSDQNISNVEKTKPTKCNYLKRSPIKRNDISKECEKSVQQGMQVKIPVRKVHKKCVHASLTAPVTSTPSLHNSVTRKVKFVGGSTFPIVTNKTQENKCQRSDTVKSDEKIKEKSDENNDVVRDSKLIYHKKVSSEYSSGAVFKIKEGLSLSNYENLSHPTSGYKLTWRQRLLGGSSNSCDYGDIINKVTGKSELAAAWLKLKADIENAMAKKPDMDREYKDINNILQTSNTTKVI